MVGWLVVHGTQHATFPPPFPSTLEPVKKRERISFFFFLRLQILMGDLGVLLILLLNLRLDSHGPSLAVSRSWLVEKKKRKEGLPDSLSPFHPPWEKWEKRKQIPPSPILWTRRRIPRGRGEAFRRGRRTLLAPATRVPNAAQRPAFSGISCKKRELRRESLLLLPLQKSFVCLPVPFLSLSSWLSTTTSSSSTDSSGSSLTSSGQRRNEEEGGRETNDIVFLYFRWQPRRELQTFLVWLLFFFRCCERRCQSAADVE